MRTIMMLFLISALAASNAEAVNPDGPPGVVVLEPWYWGAALQDQSSFKDKNDAAGLNVLVPVSSHLTLSASGQWTRFAVVPGEAPVEFGAIRLAARFYIPLHGKANAILKHEPLPAGVGTR